jgi:hypothetical protein
MDRGQKTIVGKFIRACIFVLIMIGYTPWVVTANPKTDDLKLKLADISLLRQQLQDRSQQAEQIRQALVDQQDFLAGEASLLCRTLKIKSLKQAQNNTRIHYDLELLRMIEGYLDMLEQKIRFYQTGNDKLAYLHQSASDDLKMMATLNDLKIDALSTQISLVVNQYLPEAHTILIEPAQIKPAAAETVWEKRILTID